MKAVLHIFIVFLFSLSQLVDANEQVTAVARLNSLLSSLETFKADFKQNITTETGESLDTLSGEIAIKKPGKFYWNVTQPFEQLLVADGQNLWQYDVDLEQATVRDLDESLGGTPAGILIGSMTTVGDKFKITRVAGLLDPKIEQFLLLPVEEGQFESIQLTFISEVFTQIELKDTLGQTTKVDFLNPQFGLALSEDLFIIDLPKDVELIDSRI